MMTAANHYTWFQTQICIKYCQLFVFNCSYYLKFMVCAHLASFSNHFNMHWFNDQYNNKPEIFDFKNKRGAQSKKYKKAEKALVKAL